MMLLNLIFNRPALLIAAVALLSHQSRAREESDQERGLLGFLFGGCNKCKCGRPNREARLLGGEYLRSHEFPWVALIQVRGASAISGTLINDRYVITAATQLIGLTPYDIKITLGQFDRCFPDVSSVNVSAENIIIHPDFTPGNRAHDVALIRLVNPVSFERRLSPVCLSVPGNEYLGQVATVVSWFEGVTAEGEVSSCRPRKLGLPVLGYTECLGTSSNGQFVSADKGCLGVVGATSVICKVDAGGSVTYRSRSGVYELIGVLSDKNECNEIPSTALYVKINDHLSWITQNTIDACYCLKT